jgi:hypothetical protein
MSDNIVTLTGGDDILFDDDGARLEPSRPHQARGRTAPFFSASAQVLRWMKKGPCGTRISLSLGFEAQGCRTIPAPTVIVIAASAAIDLVRLRIEPPMDCCWVVSPLTHPAATSRPGTARAE